MINTKKIFDKTIQEIAKVVKLINEDGEDVDSKIISDMNDDISDLHATLFDGSNDFVELKDLKNYIKDVVGKDYFSDKRCWEYLYDSVYEVFMDIPNEFDESMQTGLGMAQQLPTNSVYDGELDDLYDRGDKKMKKLVNGLSVDDACDMALEANFDVDDKKGDENITSINKVSDAWETYKKSWKKFNKEYLEKDFFETIAYLKKNGLFNKKANDVIDGWMDDIEQIFYSDKEPNKMELNFGFSGNDIFESKEKIMNKRLEERFDPPKDWDFDEMIEDYGFEYLSEKDPDSEPYSMDEFNELTSYADDPLEAITRAFYGGRYGFKNDSFNPNDEYFAYNGYGNLISIKDYDINDYLKEHIDESYFYDWCVEEGYFESKEDDE